MESHMGFSPKVYHRIRYYDLRICYCSEASLDFYGFATKLIVNDTLVVKGNLHLHNSNDLIINDQGILIIRGNLFIDEYTEITSNGYLIITRGYL